MKNWNNIKYRVGDLLIYKYVIFVILNSDINEIRVYGIVIGSKERYPIKAYNSVSFEYDVNKGYSKHQGVIL